MNRSLLLMSLATCLGLSGLNVSAMELNPVQIASAEHLANALVEEALQDGHDVAFVQFDVKEAFPESDKVLFHPQEIMDRVDIFDHFVKERIKTNLELIQDQTIYAQVMNSFVGQFYTATVQSNRTALREWISRWPLLPH